MTFSDSLLVHHFEAVFIGILTLIFSLSVLKDKRPTGSAFAWLLAIILIPYIGMPLYIIFGVRKIRSKNIAQNNEPIILAEAAPRHLAIAPLWLDDGVLAYQNFIDQIRSAKKTIRIMTFVIGNDIVGRSLIEALTERAQSGVKVHLLIDDLLHFHAPRGELKKLKIAGGMVQRFMPLMHIPFRGRSNLRNHRKIAIFDGERAIVGGMNLADEYMGPVVRPDRWRDISILLNGDSIERLDFIFRKNWEFAAKENLSSAVESSLSSPVRVVTSGPDTKDDAIYEGILQALFRAEKRFWIATPYFVPDETLMRALRMAAHRGVDVKIIVPLKSNHHLSDLAANAYLRELASDGIKIKFYMPGMLHAKAILIDEKKAVIGSANFDMRSLFLNYEIALVFSSAPEISHLEAWFEDTFKSTAEQFPQVGIIGKRCEDLARLLAPLL